jgi:hypothetical protein
MTLKALACAALATELTEARTAAIEELTEPSDEDVGVIEESDTGASTKLETELIAEEEEGRTAHNPALFWHPAPQDAASRPHVPSALQHLPKFEPRHVKPEVPPHVPSVEMARAAELGRSVLLELDALGSIAATALQSPYSS